MDQQNKPKRKLFSTKDVDFNLHIYGRNVALFSAFFFVFIAVFYYNIILGWTFLDSIYVSNNNNVVDDAMTL